MWSQRKRLPQATEEDAGVKGEKEEVDGKEEAESVKSAYAITAATTDLDGGLIGH